MNDVIIKAWLGESGKRLILQKGFSWNKPQEYSIIGISRPETIPTEFLLNHMTQVGYPVYINGEPIIVPKTMLKVRPDIFAAVFNGVEVCVEDSSQEIIIE